MQTNHEKPANGGMLTYIAATETNAALLQGNLLGKLDAYDSWSNRLEDETAAGRITDFDPEWDAWESVGCDIYRAVEALPDTRENARVKARTILSLCHGEGGDLTTLFDEETLAPRLAVGIIKALLAAS